MACSQPALSIFGTLKLTARSCPGMSASLMKSLPAIAFAPTGACHWFGAPAPRQSTRVVFWGPTGSRCITTSKKYSPGHTKAEDKKPTFGEIEQKGVKQRARHFLCNNDPPEPCHQSGT